MTSVSTVMMASWPWPLLLLPASLLAACASSSPSYAPAPSPTGHSRDPIHAIEVLGGDQDIQNSSSIEDARAVSAQYSLSWQDPRAGFQYGFEIGVDRAGVQASTVDPTLGAIDGVATWWEYYVGLRSTMTDLPEWIRAYSSVGFSVVDPEVAVISSGSSVGDPETSYGAYLRAGIYFPIFTHTRMGLDYRHRFFDDVEFSQTSVLFGLSW